MTTKQKIHELTKLSNHYKELTSRFDTVYNLFGSADSKFCNSVWLTFDSYLDAVSLLLEDHNEWISWFIHDNNCGEKNLSVRLGKKRIKVDSVEKMVEVIEEFNLIIEEFNLI